MKINWKFIGFLALILLILYVFKPFTLVETNLPGDSTKTYFIFPEVAKINSPLEITAVTSVRFGNLDDNRAWAYAVYLNNDEERACRFGSPAQSGQDAFIYKCTIPADRINQEGINTIKIRYKDPNILAQYCWNNKQSSFTKWTQGTINWENDCIGVNGCPQDVAFCRDNPQQKTIDVRVTAPTVSTDLKLNVLSETKYEEIVVEKPVEKTVYVDKPVEVFSLSGFWQFIKDLFKKITGG